MIQNNSKPFFTNKFLVCLVLPLVAEQFLAMTIGICDTIMVSSIGAPGVSAVSLIDQLGQLVIQLFAAFATGGAVVASQYLGHKEEDQACRSAKQLLYLCCAVGVMIIAICLPLRRFIIGGIFGGIEADIMTNALNYFVWILFSFPLIGIYNSCAALCRSMGNSKISLKVSIVMNVINVAGNALLIYGLKAGVAGAGISTLVSRGIAALIMIVILKNRKWPIHLKELWKVEINLGLIGKILKVAVPSGIENSIFHVGKTLVYSFMSGFGSVAIAANAISNSVCSFSNIPGNAVGLASVTIVGQCIGAGEKQQAKKYGRLMMYLSYAGMCITGIFILIFAPQCVKIFNLAEDISSLSVGVIRTCMIANMLFWAMSFTMPNILRGAGDAKYTMIWSLAGMWAFRVGGSYLISKYLLGRFPDHEEYALYGIWIGMYIDWVFRGAMFLGRFMGKRWLDKKVI